MLSMIRELFFHRTKLLWILDNDPVFYFFISDFVLHKVDSHIFQNCQPIVIQFDEFGNFKDLNIVHY